MRIFACRWTALSATVVLWMLAGCAHGGDAREGATAATPPPPTAASAPPPDPAAPAAAPAGSAAERLAVLSPPTDAIFADNPAPAPAAPGSEPRAVVGTTPSTTTRSTSAAPAVTRAATPTATSPASPASPPTPGGEKVYACGAKGQPKCPLQSWMASNMPQALASGDPVKLAATLRAAAKLAPPGYSAWAKIANDGAAAAEAAKDVAAGKPSCKTCHDQFQKRYRAEMRDRPI